jgi:hypothetical protein
MTAVVLVAGPFRLDGGGRRPHDTSGMARFKVRAGRAHRPDDWTPRRAGR